MGQLGACRLFWCQLENIRHSAELRKRTGLHLPHKMRAMYLHRRFADADIVGNLFVQATGRDLNHNLTFAGAERFETLPERTQGPITLALGTIASEARLDGIEEVLIAERFCQELYGAALHCLDGHRDVAMRCDEDDRHVPVRRREVALKLKAASSRHSNIEHQTGGAVRSVGIQKIGYRRKLPGMQADRPQQTLDRVAKLGIVIDDRDAGVVVTHPRSLH